MICCDFQSLNTKGWGNPFYLLVHVVIKSHASYLCSNKGSCCHRIDFIGIRQWNIKQGSQPWLIKQDKHEIFLMLSHP